MQVQSCPQKADAQVQWPEVPEKTEKKEEVGGGEGGLNEEVGKKGKKEEGVEDKKGENFSSNGTN